LFRHRKEKRPTDQDERLHRSNHIISEIAELEDVNEGPFFLNAASRIVCSVIEVLLLANIIGEECLRE